MFSPSSSRVPVVTNDRLHVFTAKRSFPSEQKFVKQSKLDIPLPFTVRESATESMSRFRRATLKERRRRKGGKHGRYKLAPCNSRFAAKELSFSKYARGRRDGVSKSDRERARLPPRVGFSRVGRLVGVLVKSDVLQRPRRRLRNRPTSSHGARHEDVGCSVVREGRKESRRERRKRRRRRRRLRGKVEGGTWQPGMRGFSGD